MRSRSAGGERFDLQVRGRAFDLVEHASQVRGEDDAQAFGRRRGAGRPAATLSSMRSSARSWQ